MAKTIENASKQDDIKSAYALWGKVRKIDVHHFHGWRQVRPRQFEGLPTSPTLIGPGKVEMSSGWVLLLSLAMPTALRFTTSLAASSRI
jgi:hypothetical protein